MSVATVQERGHLPGCIRSIDLAPAPRWPVALRNTRALHGVLTALDGRPHDKRRALFGLLPWQGGCGWAVQWYDDEAPELPSRNGVHVFNGARELRLGPPMRLRWPMSPAVDATLCIDTVTPLLVRADGRALGAGARDTDRFRRSLSAENLVSALENAAVLEHLLGARPARAGLGLELVLADAHPTTVLIGGRWSGCGTVVGVEGRIIVRANAATRRLLELAALVGLGSRVSLGFGRFRLREVRP